MALSYIDNVKLQMDESFKFWQGFSIHALQARYIGQIS